MFYSITAAWWIYSVCNTFLGKMKLKLIKTKIYSLKQNLNLCSQMWLHPCIGMTAATVRAALLWPVSWDTAEEWRSMFFLPVCQCWSISVCGSDLWPAADKCVVMRQRAHWACSTPIIKMESHTPPLHQPLFSSVSVLEKKDASSSTSHISSFSFLFLQLTNKIKDILINLNLMHGLFCPSHLYLDLCFLEDLFYMLNYYGFFPILAIISAWLLSNGCFISRTKLTVQFGGFFAAFQGRWHYVDHSEGNIQVTWAKRPGSRVA